MAERVTTMASQGMVVIFGASCCCMSHAMTRLFAELGVSLRCTSWTRTPRGRIWRGRSLAWWARARQCRQYLSVAR
uniref:Glutaredoxin domain-containing protein n=1 Tax=Aegilops tauschii subsp. strangulata TaxID=200361 RepID=A0A453GI91_AEGTS